MRPVLWLVVSIVLSGCVSGPPPSVEVGPPADGGGFGACASRDAQPMALALQAASTKDGLGLGPGIHVLDASTLLWVWAEYDDTQRQDRVTRLNEVQAFREANGTFALCTRVELATPTVVDGERTSYAVAARFTSSGAFPEGEWKVVVNWVAGCNCETNPRGNTTAFVRTPTAVPETA